MNPYLLLSLIVPIVLLVVGIFFITYWAWRFPKREISTEAYRVFFYLGIGYLVAGAFLSFVYPGNFSDFFILMILGVLFLGVGVPGLKKGKNG